MLGLIELQWIPDIRGAINGDMVFQNIKVDDITNNQAGPQVSKQIGIPGSASQDAASPPFLAVVLQLQTEVRGRQNHGRLMMGGQSPGIFSGGIMNGLGEARWNPAVSNLRNHFLKNGSAWNGDFALILSSGNHGVDQIREVKNIVLRTTQGSQNSRKLGVGI